MPEDPWPRYTIEQCAEMLTADPESCDWLFAICHGAKGHGMQKGRRGVMAFQPRISIGDSQIHAGRKTWVFHLPGDAEERYGLIPDMSRDFTINRYVETINRRFNWQFTPKDVECPTEQDVALLIATPRPGRLSNFSQVKNNRNYIAAWKRMIAVLQESDAPLKRKDLAERLAVSEITVYGALNGHKDIFWNDRGLIGLVAKHGPNIPRQVLEITEKPHQVNDNYTVKIETGPAQQTLMERAYADFRALIEEARKLASNSVPQTPRSWHEQLLDKFPAFNPEWPENVKIEWFSAFESLMAVRP